ncbi:hypothetical protein C5167_043383 [Papaver somniferum]|uniref:DUF1677 family protein n=1 Tax=Papaver somniferum TaxID=3469 RepID=A0A4Y7L5J2_PAPSO|nr:uncharacterized protein LOC113317279 [Papaver somniferum]RZC80803.1 hypothetical protein C5167_043383 [Papaver somniferum]
MDIEMIKCECCGLKEECTQDYIAEVKAKFDGKWLCGLCAEAVRDEVTRENKKKKKIPFEVDEEAMKAHMSFCRKFKSSPAKRVADGMRQILRRGSGNNLTSSTSTSTSTPKKYTRSASTSQVVHLSTTSFTLY